MPTLCWANTIGRERALVQPICLHLDVPTLVHGTVALLVLIAFQLLVKVNVVLFDVDN